MMRNSTETSVKNLVPERFLYPKTSEKKQKEDKGSLSVLVWPLSGSSWANTDKILGTKFEHSEGPPNTTSTYLKKRSWDTDTFRPSGG